MRTITFYSYKGGTGRTLLLVNTAYFLAQLGQRVVLLDLDLEAPGLHNKLGLAIPEPKKLEDLSAPLKRKNLANGQVGPGSVDMLLNWQNEHFNECDINEYVYDVTINGPGGEHFVKVIPAGPAPSLHYEESLHRFDWAKLAKMTEPGVEWLKDVLEYGEKTTLQCDYLLVDSRTGITDAGTLALHGMADTAVCLFTTTPESINGISLIMEGLTREPVPPNIVPTLSRVPLDLIDKTKEIKKICTRVNNALREQVGNHRHFQLDPEQLVTIRSAPALQVEERVILGSNATIRDSMIVLDYMKFFDRLGLPNSIFTDDDQKLIKLYRNYPISLSRSKRAVPAISMFDDVKNSGLKYLPSLLEPNYFTKFIEQVRNYLAALTNGAASNMSWRYSGTSFDNLAFSMSSDKPFLHFFSDMYYLTPSRSQLVDVFPVGKVMHYGFSITPESEVPLSSDREMRELLLAELLPQRFPNHLIGMLAETAATSDILPDLSEHQPGDKCYIALSPEKLETWANSTTENVLIADIDVLNDMGKRVDSEIPYRNDSGLQAGLVYPAGDYKWRAAISVAIAKALEAIAKTMTQNVGTAWLQVSESLKKVGIQPLGGSDLLRELLLDMAPTQAKQWQQRLHTLIESESNNHKI